MASRLVFLMLRKKDENMNKIDRCRNGKPILLRQSDDDGDKCYLCQSIVLRNSEKPGQINNVPMYPYRDSSVCVNSGCKFYTRRGWSKVFMIRGS